MELLAWVIVLCLVFSPEEVGTFIARAVKSYKTTLAQQPKR